MRETLNVTFHHKLTLENHVLELCIKMLTDRLLR